MELNQNKRRIQISSKSIRYEREDKGSTKKIQSTIGFE